jgi:hypothetical protein
MAKVALTEIEKERRRKIAWWPFFVHFPHRMSLNCHSYELLRVFSIEFSRELPQELFSYFFNFRLAISQLLLEQYLIYFHCFPWQRREKIQSALNLKIAFTRCFLSKMSKKRQTHPWMNREEIFHNFGSVNFLVNSISRCIFPWIRRHFCLKNWTTSILFL